jgi:hypothetical protein
VKKQFDLQGAIWAGMGALIIGLTGWLMTTTLGVDKDQDVMEIRLDHAEENYDKLRLDSPNHSMDTCPVCMHMKLGSN